MARSLEELEFERNRQEILKQNRNHKKKRTYQNVPMQVEAKGSQRYAWEYELEVYKEQKKRERFYTFGAWCGILSLILTLLANYRMLLEVLGVQ